MIRPPLVYGPSIKTNFRRMTQWLCRGVPLPLGAIHNRRSLVGLDNLVDLIITCLRHPSAANQNIPGRRWGRSVDDPVAQTTRLPGPFHSVQAPLLRLGLAMLNQREMGQRLCGSLQVDISRASELLNWKPPLSVYESLRRVAIDFLERHQAATHGKSPQPSDHQSTRLLLS